MMAFQPFLELTQIWIHHWNGIDASNHHV